VGCSRPGRAAVGGCRAVPDDAFDAFVSYSRRDAGWVTVLADNLQRLGLHVFLDEYELGEGGVIVHALDDGLRRSRAGVLVVSPDAIASSWVRNEYAVLMQRSIVDGQPLIPVLLRDAELPPLLATRFWVDFRTAADEAGYLQAVRRLAGALRGQRRQRPAPGSALVVPPGLGARPEGPRSATLRVTGDEVTLLAGDREVRAPHAGVDYATRERLLDLSGARRFDDGAVLRDAAGGDAGLLDLRLADIGTGLGRAFLAGEPGTALAGEVAAAGRANAALRLAVEVDDPDLADLPWETLTLPGGTGPLALDRSVQFYRRVPVDGAVPGMAIPGPLRILVLIASPDTGGGELVDYERELRLILDSVDPARTRAQAYVRMLNDGSLAQRRGEYGPAEQHYRRSLAIKEQLGDQAGRAFSQGQLGALYTDQGRPAEGFPYTVAALSFFMQAGAPEANVCISSLRAQRTALGDARFAELLREYLDADSVGTVLSSTTPDTDERPAGRRTKWFGRRRRNG
jgi:hypothetical protein